MLTVTGFDASQQVDLMAASVSAMNGSLSAPVSFSFTHLLSRIQIVGKRNEATVGIEGFMPRIHEVKLYGMPGSGGLSINAADLSDKTKILSSWTGSDVTTSDSPLIVFRSDTGAEVTREGTLLIDVLPLPQYITRDYYVEVEYSTNGTSGEHKTATIQLNSLPVTKWEVGRQYRYTFSVLDDDRILFDIPTVNAWDEAVGGIIIVD